MVPERLADAISEVLIPKSASNLADRCLIAGMKHTKQTMEFWYKDYVLASFVFSTLTVSFVAGKAGS